MFRALLAPFLDAVTCDVSSGISIEEFSMLLAMRDLQVSQDVLAALNVSLEI